MHKFIKKFSNFLSESYTYSIETKDGYIIDEEDINDIFSEYIEDVPQLKDAKISCILGSNNNLKPDTHSGEVDFTITFFLNILQVDTPVDKKLYPPEKQWFNRFFVHHFIRHDHLFKKDIINRIDDRMFDQFGYHLIKMDKSGGGVGYWIDFCFGKKRKVNHPYFRNVDTTLGNGRYGNPQ